MVEPSNKTETPSRKTDEGLGLFDLLLQAIMDIPRLMRTLKFAVWLILILAIFTLVGSILPQEHMVSDLDELARQYAGIFRVNPDDGRTTFGEIIYNYVVVPLELYRVFDTGLYFVLLALLAVSSALCAWDRFFISRKILKRTDPTVQPPAVEALPHSATGTVDASIETTRERLGNLLKRQGFQVFDAVDDEDGTSWFFVRKNAFRYTASVVFHAAFAIILIGGIIGDDRVFGYEGYVRMGEGEVRALGSEIQRFKEADAAGLEYESLTDEVLELVDYENIYRERDFPGIDPETGFPIQYMGTPSDYVSHLRVIRPTAGGEDEEVVRERRIEVNHPLRYNGVAYFQSAFDTVFHFTVSVPGEGDIPLEVGLDRRFLLPGLNLETVITRIDAVGGVWEAKDGSRSDLPYVVRINEYTRYFAGYTNQPDIVGYVSENSPLELDGVVVSLDSVEEYTILQYSRDPGVPIVYLGGFLLMVGLTIVLYVPYRMGRIILKKHDAGTSYVVGGNWDAFPGMIASALDERC